MNAKRHGVETHSAPFLSERPDGSPLRTEISSVLLRSDNSAVTGVVSVVMDVEERERAVHQNLLIGELAHRMKNSMALVQAIVHQSLRSAGTLAEARQSVVSRLEALVRAQDLLTRVDWQLNDLGTVARSALETVSRDGRLVIEGCPVKLGAWAAKSFTLVLHELATNPLKYGALSAPKGRSQVRWHVKASATGRCLLFSWKKLNGPVVSSLSHNGFGTRLIDNMGRGFGGRRELLYDPAGVRWQGSADTEHRKTT